MRWDEDEDEVEVVVVDIVMGEVVGCGVSKGENGGWRCIWDAGDDTPPHRSTRVTIAW